MVFNIWLFLVGLIVPYLIWLLWILITEGPEGILKRKKKQPKQPKAAAAEAPKPPEPEPERVTEVPVRLDHKPGFRDVRWGEAPVTAMELLKENGDEAVYMRSTDTMRLGEGHLMGINYQYWQGKCAAVIIQVAPGSLEQVLTHLTTIFGKASHPKEVYSKFVWMAMGSGENVTQAMLDADLEKKSGTLVIFSKSMADARRKVEGGTSPAA